MGFNSILLDLQHSICLLSYMNFRYNWIHKLNMCCCQAILKLRLNVIRRFWTKMQIELLKQKINSCVIGVNATNAGIYWNEPSTADNFHIMAVLSRLLRIIQDRKMLSHGMECVIARWNSFIIFCNATKDSSLFSQFNFEQENSPKIVQFQ